MRGKHDACKEFHSDVVWGKKREEYLLIVLVLGTDTVFGWEEAAKREERLKVCSGGTICDWTLKITFCIIICRKGSNEQQSGGLRGSRGDANSCPTRLAVRL